MTAQADFLDRGWCSFAPDTRVQDWLIHARTAIETARNAPEFDHWYRHGRTWFAGVNALPNDVEGRVGAGPALQAAALEFAGSLYGPLTLDKAQISTVLPGYPRQDPGTSDAAHRFRLNRDAAHVDGLSAQGPARRRFLDEPHAWVLGLPATVQTQSPMVVWEGSHHIMRRAFSAVLGDVAEPNLGAVDLTQTYHAARREAFETCRRVPVSAAPGASYLIHRLTLHGLAPWDSQMPGNTPRTVLYFRPDLARGRAAWLTAP